MWSQDHTVSLVKYLEAIVVLSGCGHKITVFSIVSDQIPRGNCGLEWE